MFIGRVIGNLVSTAKHPAFKGQKLLIVERIGVLGSAKSKPVIAIDTVLAGDGDIVLVGSEGSAAKAALADEKAPVRSVIFAVVDRYEIEDKEE